MTPGDALENLARRILNYLMECWACGHSWWAVMDGEAVPENVPCPACGEENPT